MRIRPFHAFAAAAALASGLAAGCGVGDAGKAACEAWVEEVNACVADTLDVEVRCADGIFEAAASAGCSWQAHYESCLENFACDGAETLDPQAVADLCEGSCE